MPNKKVLVIGGATLDTIIQYEDMETLIHQRHDQIQSYLLLEEGKKIEVSAQQTASGGGATNAAVSFKRQGFDVNLFCKLGKDVAGERILRELQSYDLDLSNIRFDEKEGTATSFVVPSLKGDRTVFAYRGANAHLLDDDLPLDPIKKADFLYITSLSKSSASHLPAIVAKAQKDEVKVAVNPGVSQMNKGGSALQESLHGIDILILNQEEAQALMISVLQGEGLLEGSFAMGYFNLKEFFKKILSLGPKIVVVTNGGDGVHVATAEKLYFHKAPKIKIVNTLGAGDAFGSGFTGAYYQTRDIAHAIRAGIANSASVIQYPDAKEGLLSQQELQKKLADLQLDALSVSNWD
ncbi:MAG: carbohydrate kinase family protein [Gammaproteobacteria bacterium]|nr:carbohydrate kinase family protein [Gammaproteobacteria bacterium]